MSLKPQFGLVADVGGTNIRLALVSLESGEISQIKALLCAEYDSLAEAVEAYLHSIDPVYVESACVAIACPTESDWISMTNHSWEFSVQETRRRLELENLWLINDYTAISQALPELGDAQRIQIGGGEAAPAKPIAVFGPGTGLGVAHLVNVDNRWISLPGEGGHVDFAPIDAVDSHILGFLNRIYEHVSVEQLLSGPGLVQIYQALADYNQKQPEALEPADITSRALENSCPVCRQTLERFCAILGSFGGNLALTLGTFGGVYIAGGIAPRFVDFIKQTDFRARFEAKGRFRDYLSSIPTYVITEAQPGLIGAAAYLRQSLR